MAKKKVEEVVEEINQEEIDAEDLKKLSKKFNCPNCEFGIVRGKVCPVCHGTGKKR